MTSTVPIKYYALLVGIDMYLDDGSRKNENGESLLLKNLQGCVNDVRAVQEFLQTQFQLNEPCVLTSTAPPKDALCKEPVEMPEFWPTFRNIKHEFDTITEQATAGDFFFFHFSGHGALLRPTDRSPKGRLADPSLITVDYCNSNAAVRGWQLNEWLKRLHDKNVRIVVILDSCHAGGGWRTDAEGRWRTGVNFRTPEGWSKVPNNAADEAAIMETSSESSYRDSELSRSWGINPQGFTLMAACESDQQAEERQYEDKYHGVFTYTLLACLQQALPDSLAISYRTLRDQVHERLRLQSHQQTPRVYGRDRLLFLRDREPFSATPLIAQIDGGIISLPLGRFHGVYEGSEFTTFPSVHVTFSVNQVDEFRSSARILPHQSDISKHSSCNVIPSRWSLGKESLRVFVHHDLGSEFRQSLHTAIEERVVADIRIMDLNGPHVHGSLNFTLKKRGDLGIDLFGPISLIGYESPVRGVNITGNNNQELSISSAIILRHLARFSQILDLKELSSKSLEPFELSLVRKENESSTSKLRQTFQFTSKNTGDSPLFCTVLCLGPAFNVKQLYPPQDSPATLTKDRPISFGFHISIPEELKSYSQQRDIIRTIITKGKPLSWRFLELPHIWNAQYLEVKPQRNSFGRDASLATDYGVWIHDECVFV